MKPTLKNCLVPPAMCIRQRGFTLIELMVAITIGMLIVAALLALFLNVSRTNNEMAKANRQIENGRFAIQLLQNDLIHAGFWGNVRPVVPTFIPDPCLAAGSWGTVANYKENMLAVPVLAYSSTSIPSSCTTVSSAQSNSDVLVVRHANTCTAGTTNCEGGADSGPHIQVSACTSSTPPEVAYLIDSATFPLREKDCATIAGRRKIVSNIYYVSNNTLMRSAFVDGTYQTAQPLIEGIEALRLEYGIDSSGDGSPDSYLIAPPTTLVELGNIVAVKIHVLARNLEATPGYAHSKSYQLGNTTPAITPGDDGFKRHVFSTTVRLVNPSGRREVP